MLECCELSHQVLLHSKFEISNELIKKSMIGNWLTKSITQMLIQ